MSPIHDAWGAAERGAREVPPQDTERQFPAKRRSSRLALIIPVVIQGTDADGNVFKENAWTISVNRHGGKLATMHRMLPNALVTVENAASGDIARARVVFIGKGNYPFEIGVELFGSSSVWGIKFPPEDWKSEPGGPEARDTARSKLPADAGLALAPATTDSAASATTAASEDALVAGGSADSVLPRETENPALQPADNTVLSAAKSEAITEAALKTAEAPPDVEALPPKAEPPESALSTLLDKIEEARQQLRTEIDEAQKQIRELAGPVLESALRECRSKMESATSSVIEAAISTARAQWEEASRKFLDEAVTRQVASEARRLSEKIQGQEAAFNAHLQQMATQASDRLVHLCHDLKEIMKSDAEAHIEFAARQVRQETNDALILFKDELQSASREVLADCQKQMEGSAQTALASVSQKGEAVAAEAQKLVESQVSSAAEDQIRSVVRQVRQETNDALILFKDELQSAPREVLADCQKQMEGLVQAALASVSQKSEAIAAEAQRLVESQLSSAQEQLAAAGERAATVVAQQSMTIESEYRRKAERVFAEAMDTRIHEFEDRLARGGQEHLVAAGALLKREVEPVRQQSIAQVKEQTDKLANGAVGIVQQGLGVAALMLKDWTEQATKRLQDAVQASARSSRQQMGEFMQAALEELHQGASLQMRDLRDRLRQAASVLENIDPGAGSPMPQKIEAASDGKVTPASIRQPDEFSERSRQGLEKSRENTMEDAVKEFRAKLDEILRPAA